MNQLDENSQCNDMSKRVNTFLGCVNQDSHEIVVLGIGLIAMSRLVTSIRGKSTEDELEVSKKSRENY